MAYKRFARRKRRMGYRRGKKGLATKVKALSKYVHRNKIVHRVDTDYYATYASWLGNQDRNATVACQNISLAPQLGVVFDSRQTPCIRAQTLKLCFSALTSSVTDVVRVQVFMLRDPFQPSLGAQTLFNPLNSTILAPMSPLVPSALCAQAYKIMYDSGPRQIGTTGGSLPEQAWTKTLNMKGKQFQYAGQGSNAFPEQDNVYCVVWGQEAPGAGPVYLTNTTVTVGYQWTYST